MSDVDPVIAQIRDKPAVAVAVHLNFPTDACWGVFHAQITFPVSP